MMSDKVYNALKFVAQYVLPATASLYFGLAAIWGLPYSEQVVGTILAVDAFLGAVLGVAVNQYNKKMAKTDKYVQRAMPRMEVTETKTTLAMSNEAYYMLYWVAQILVPALGALYFALASIWQFPYAQQVSGTIALVDTFMGILLGISTNQYNKALQEVPA